MSSAVAIRWASQGHIDEDRVDPAFAERQIVGTLVPDVDQPRELPLNLREAYNKIIHAKHTELGNSGTGDPYTEYLTAVATLHSDFDARTGWRATLDIVKYAAAGSAIAEAFA